MASLAMQPEIPEASTAVASDFDGLVEQVLAGNDAAWTAFVDRVHPTALAICRRRGFVGGDGDAEDLRRDVALRALDRMRADDFAALRAFVRTRASHRTASFVTWLAVVVRNAYVDHLRKQPEYQRVRDETGRRLARVAREPLEDRAGESIDPMTAIEVRRALDCVMSDVFPREQRAAIALWLRGCDNREIAEALGLADAAEANRLLHAARQRLRRAVHGGTR